LENFAYPAGAARAGRTPEISGRIEAEAVAGKAAVGRTIAEAVDNGFGLCLRTRRKAEDGGRDCEEQIQGAATKLQVEELCDSHGPSSVKVDLGICWPFESRLGAS
jgi:hypothetical protein